MASMRILPWALGAIGVLLLVICSKLDTLNDSINSLNQQVYNVKIATELVSDTLNSVSR